MSAVVNGYTLNAVGDPPPNGAIEQALLTAIVGLLPAYSDATATTDNHKHVHIKDASNSEVVLGTHKVDVNIDGNQVAEIVTSSGTDYSKQKMTLPGVEVDSVTAVGAVASAQQTVLSLAPGGSSGLSVSPFSIIGGYNNLTGLGSFEINTDSCVTQKYSVTTIGGSPAKVTILQITAGAITYNKPVIPGGTGSLTVYSSAGTPPTTPIAGTLWLDTSAGSYGTIKCYTGAAWKSVGVLA